MDLELNHFAHRVASGSLEFVLELFGQMNCSFTYMDKEMRWGLVEQNGTYIQFIETADEPIPSETKKNSHIAFLSAAPEEDIRQIRQWAAGRGHELVQGAWSAKEHWFDFPRAFTDFVVEIMQPAVGS